MTEARAGRFRALLYAGDPKAALEAIGEPAGQTVEGYLQNALDQGRIRDPYQRAWRLAFLGKTDSALSAVEEALRERSPMMPMISAEPGFVPLCPEKRVQAVVAKMGF